MPLNTLRLNHLPSSHPNERIVFIKPLSRPPSQQADYDQAELILKAIAAQCLPIMKDHYLSVTTLEEYEPNPEFIGRNFNNGEIIQLVIQSRSGAWLPLNMIQMVMMHELAHNTHMNHGKGFWQTRNLYASEMRQLWSKSYTGDGLWGQGRTLNSLQQELGGHFVRSEELGDLRLCGGTFRSRRKKRKAKGPQLNWKDKRDKRIEKKFGKDGIALGEDEDKRLALEINSKGPIGSKPRVAQSKRGRELRAAAALARFATNKEAAELDAATKQEEDGDEVTASESEYEELDAKQEDARDIDGDKFVDGKGQTLIRVCKEEDTDELEVKNELKELADLDYSAPSHDGCRDSSTTRQTPGQTADLTKQSKTPNHRTEDSEPGKEGNSVQVRPLANVPSQDKNVQNQCPMCSMTNESLRSTCVACAHVMDVRKDPRHWRCHSDTCKDSCYVNAGDCGVCGLCGTAKPGSTERQN